MLLGGTAVFVQTMGTDQAVIQKFLTTRSTADTKRSLYFHGAVLIILMSLLSMLGVLLYVLYAANPAIRDSLRNPGRRSTALRRQDAAAWAVGSRGGFDLRRRDGDVKRRH